MWQSEWLTVGVVAFTVSGLGLGHEKSACNQDGSSEEESITYKVAELILRSIMSVCHPEICAVFVDTRRSR